MHMVVKDHRNDLECRTNLSNKSSTQHCKEHTVCLLSVSVILSVRVTGPTTLSSITVGLPYSPRLSDMSKIESQILYIPSAGLPLLCPVGCEASVPPAVVLMAKVPRC